MAALDRSPAYVAVFLAFLTVPQVVAMAAQFRGGFRPFVHEPDRVALSWDMFAIEISRCDLRWDPPLDIGGRSLATLRAAGQPLEWDPVYNKVEQYVMAARFGCTFARPGTQVRLQCATAEGRMTRDAFLCR